MNFFERQQQSKTRMRWLQTAFVLSALIVSLALSGVLTLLVWLWWSSTFLWPLFWVVAIAFFAGQIALSSYRLAQLRRDDPVEIIESIGGEPLEPDASDRHFRLYYSVVEEMAIASGAPVPRIYWLPNEPNINAISVGTTIDDACIALTQGAIELLDRQELQGMVAHEFSHILEGDMQLNYRLMGMLYGVLLVTLLGQNLLGTSSSTKDDEGGGDLGDLNDLPIAIIGWTLMIIGGLGLMASRLIKAMISREGDFYADAHAVQFTRLDDGISSALLKIKVNKRQSFLIAHTEEVEHMLFASGKRFNLFAMHAPIMERLAAIGAFKDDRDFKQARQALEAYRKKKHAVVNERYAQMRDATMDEDMGVDEADAHERVEATSITQNIGAIDQHGLMSAALSIDMLPELLTHYAHDSQGIQALMVFFALNDDAESRAAQLRRHQSMITRWLRDQLQHLESIERPDSNQQLLLLEMLWPYLRRLSKEDLAKLHRICQQLMAAEPDKPIHYLMSRWLSDLLASESHDHSEPQKSLALHGVLSEVAMILSLMVEQGMQEATQDMHAQESDSQGDEARARFESALKALELEHSQALQVSYQPLGAVWFDQLDEAIDKLNRLEPKDKSRLVKGLVVAALADDALVANELIMLRILCARLHVPIATLKTQFQKVTTSQATKDQPKSQP